MFAYGSQIIEGEDGAKHRRGGNYLRVFYLCLHAHIYSIVVHCK